MKKIFFGQMKKPSWTSAALIIAADSAMGLSDAKDLFLKDQSTLY